MDWLAPIQTWLHFFTDDPDRLRITFATLVGLTILLVILAGYYLITGLSNPLRKRVSEVTGKAQPSEQAIRSAAMFEDLIESVGGRLILKQTAKRRRIESMLLQGGFREEGALNLYLGISLAAVVLTPMVTFLVLSFAMAKPMGDATMYSLLAASLGVLLPERILGKLVKRRHGRLRRGLPDAMDLLVICTEAGLGLNGAIGRVAKELAIAHPELADELGMFPMQTRSGMDSRAALKDLVERTGVDEIQSLVALMLQGMRFGTSVAESLRIFSYELRSKRLQEAEERAAKIGSQMIFPVVVCILPSFILALMGPPVIAALKSW